MNEDISVSEKSKNKSSVLQITLLSVTILQKTLMCHFHKRVKKVLKVFLKLLSQ